MNRAESIQAVISGKERPMLKWDTHMALALIVLGSFVSLAVLRGSLSAGGAIQP